MQNGKLRKVKVRSKRGINTALMCCLLWAGLSLAWPMAASEAATYHVKKDGSGDFTTILAALNASTAGDTILVYQGDYTNEGRIRFPAIAQGTSSSNMLTIKSEPRRAATVSRFNLYSNANAFVRIEGFNFIHSLGYSADATVGIRVTGEGAYIYDNYFEVNSLALRIDSNNAYIGHNQMYKVNIGGWFTGDNVVFENNEI